jgi:3-isopropylmalate/(R)-2-methylmalate dehydratase small subunit
MTAVEPFTTHCGIAAPLPQPNIDTDVIMPKQFLKGVTREGLGRGLFYDLRFDEQGAERQDFILNTPAYSGAKFLVVGPNFGCGSSREHAVWGLAQFGIRAVIGTGFASIFHDNCFRNGILPVILDTQSFERVRLSCSDPNRNTLCIDLRDETIELPGAIRLRFSIDALRRDDMLNGRDAVSSTLQFANDIQAFERTHWMTHPWLKAAAPRR